MFTLLKGFDNNNYGNIGDKLVFEACKFLLLHHCGLNNFKVYHIKDNLDKVIKNINKSKALILCGGPILGSKRESFYPKYVKFTKNLSDIDIPIIPFGVGIFPSLDELSLSGRDYFDYSSRCALNFIREKSEFFSVRDSATKKVLNDLGISNVATTGCPVLFSPLSHTNANFNNLDIKNIAVSIGAGHSVSLREIRYVNQKLLKAISSRFKDCNLYCTLHHDKKSRFNRNFDFNKIKKLGYSIIDLGGNDTDYLKKFYRNIDMHIGFRIHAHIWFLIHGKPSFLIWEDGRGKAFSDTFELKNDTSCKEPDFDAKIISNIEEELANNLRSFNKFNSLHNNYFDAMNNFLKSIKRV